MTPTFGMYIRAARLGFHWTPSRGAFVRMADAGPNCTRIDLAPPDHVPTSLGRNSKFHRCWWENGDPEALLDLVEPLRNVRSVKKPITFYVDDEGRLAREGP